VSRLARKHATVLLSGEGGDEAFAGYTNYRNLVWLERIKRGLSFLNPAVSQGLSLANSLLHSPQVAEYASLMNERFPDYYYSRSSNPHRYAGNGLSRIYSEEFASGIDRQRTLQPLRDLQERTRDKSTLNAMLYIDTKTWLPDDLLVKADKMTMANSIELRVPLLDHKVLEFAASLPDRFKLNGFTTKYLLKKVLSRSIPREIIERKKTGFPVPYESWIRKDLKNFVWDVLTDSKTTNRAFFRKDAIEQLLRANAANGSHGKEIFSLLSLELWQRAFLVRETVAA
jgi:asparagine synthase (glutamine-hydrolysing)